MDKHRTILGALFLALGIMGLIGMAIVFTIFFIGGTAIGIAAANESDVPAILSILPLGFGLFICFAIAVQTLPSLIAAYGLLGRRRWGQVWALIAGILNVPHMPFGTAVGVYAIWYFAQKSVNERPATVSHHGAVR